VDAVLQSIDTMIGDKVTSQYYSPLAAAEHISIMSTFLSLTRQVLLAMVAAPKI